jgi:uncharacterized membrane protein (DUF485 family)
MNLTVKQPVAIACLFTWIGFVCAISFMEAWLKFRAPGVTLPVGLGIGRLVFGALNRIEWLLAAVTCVSAMLYGRPLLTVSNISLCLIVLILFTQTVCLLPLLDARAEQYIQAQPVEPSDLHFWFIGAELIKVAALFIMAVSLFKKT